MGRDPALDEPSAEVNCLASRTSREEVRKQDASDISGLSSHIGLSDRYVWRKRFARTGDRLIANVWLRCKKGVGETSPRN